MKKDITEAYVAAVDAPTLDYIVAAATAIALGAFDDVTRLLQLAGDDPRGLALAAYCMVHGRNDAGLGEYMVAAAPAARVIATREAGLLAAALAAGDSDAADALSVWRSLADAAGLAHDAGAHPTAVANPFGGSAPVEPIASTGEVAALLAIATAWRHDPVLADRLVSEHLDGSVDIGERGPGIVELFRALGDPGRSMAIAERIAAVSDRDPTTQLAVALAAARLGNGARALQEFVVAAASSGDPGRVFLVGARALSEAGLHVEALTLGRDALAVTAKDEAQDVLLAVAATMRELGRERDAAAMCRAWRSSLSPAGGTDAEEESLDCGAPSQATAASDKPPRAATVLTDLAQGFGRHGRSGQVSLEKAARGFDRLRVPIVGAVLRALAVSRAD
jgi:hypothetical protein